MKKVLITYYDIVKFNSERGCLVLDEVIEWFNCQPDVTNIPSYTLKAKLSDVLQKIINNLAEFNIKLKSLEDKLTHNEKSKA